MDRSGYIKAASVEDKTVMVEFSDQPAFVFHGLWLRDSCNCPAFDSNEAPRRLRSCYMERDTLHSNLRILAKKLGDPLQNAIFTTY